MHHTPATTRTKRIIERAPRACYHGNELLPANDTLEPLNSLAAVFLALPAGSLNCCAGEAGRLDKVSREAGVRLDVRVALRAEPDGRAAVA